MFKLIIIAAIATVVTCNWTDDLMGFFTNSKKEEPQGNARVVGGETASERVPYQISMQMKRGGGGGGSLFPFLNQNSNRNWSHFCGGSVLNENYILTAAHCVNFSSFNPEKVSIFAGTNDLNKEDEGQRRMVDNCVMHPDYVELNNSDVAVCKLKEPFQLDETISPIQLDTNYVQKEECTLTGWGYNTMIKGMPLPTKLQRLDYSTLTNEECNQRGHNVGPKEVCAADRFGKGACNGDSGGPLVLKGTNTLVGIVSYGTAICAVSVPDVYTRSSEFVEWIQENSQ